MSRSRLDLSVEQRRRLLEGELADPHAVLGVHHAGTAGRQGIILRAFHPAARQVGVRLDDGREIPLEPLGDGLFGTLLEGLEWPLAYRLHWTYFDGKEQLTDDPYRFPPTVGEVDLHLLAEGTHRRLADCLGARSLTVGGLDGVAFAVWAPNAAGVTVTGSFCMWDDRRYPMRSLGGSGVWELFIPGVAPGSLYKYLIRTRQGALRVKCDPVATATECPPGTASIVSPPAGAAHRWHDGEWMAARARRDPRREPLLVYEVHLGSWAGGASAGTGEPQRPPADDDADTGRFVSYRRVASRLAEHVLGLGFTHIELMPIMEHPFGGSWGYQVTGQFAPTARYGSPDDFRYLVDTCHQAGLGVILDWVPAHFPKDDFALRRFDGTELYGHEDPRRGEHPDWGTLIYNYGRNEVCAFLLSAALHWFEHYHIDGLRIDAVASMLYLDYSRRAGEWLPNRYGGRENLEAIEFLKALNTAVAEQYPGCFTAAEESTAWSGVTGAVAQGGLGFTFKWNMGWMHDTLLFFSKDPVYRGHDLDQLTFAQVYEHTEEFIMPLSHDEVVHGKGALLQKMPGDRWQKFANLRLLLTYQYTRPGKILLFMGTELAPDEEWHHDRPLDWGLGDDPPRAGLCRLIADLGALYRDRPALWRGDPDPEGFEWIEHGDRSNAVVSYLRRWQDEILLVVLNLTPVPRRGYRIGCPRPGRYVERISTDDPRYGGSGWASRGTVLSEPAPLHGRPASLELDLPPLAAVLLSCE